MATKGASEQNTKKNETWLARYSSELSIDVYPEKPH